MNIYLPTYEDCIEICKYHNNFNFFESKFIIDNFFISVFNYRLVSADMLIKPLPNSDISAEELRGITFVFNLDGSLYKRYLLLNKFFNLNQTPCSSYDVVKNLSIKEITYKEDGSIISFIRLPNDRILAKSKGSFDSEQAIAAQEIYEKDKILQNFVNFFISTDCVPVFEFCSPKNRIVVNYLKTELILIKLRNNITGDYIDIKSPDIVISKAKFIDDSLDELITKCKTDTGYEGFVIQFTNDKLIKLKLQEYIDLHHLHTEDLHKEDSLIKLILEEKIDDILCRLDENDERRNHIIELIEIINKSIIRQVKKAELLLSKYESDIKQFALRYKKEEMFYIVMRFINNKTDIIESVKEKILKDTKFLMSARKWIKDEKENGN